LAVGVAVCACAVLAAVHVLRESFRERAGWWPGREKEAAFPAPDQASASELAHALEITARRLVERFPDSPYSWDVLALWQHREGNHKEAERHWQKCIELDPGFINAYMGLGFIGGVRADHEKVAQWMRKVLSIDPDHHQAVVLLAKALMDMDRADEAAAALENYLGTRRASVAVVVALGQAYLQLEAWDKAQRALQTAVRIMPDCPEAWFGMGTACARLGEQDRAAEALEKYRALKSDAQTAERNQRKVSGELPAVRRLSAEIFAQAGEAYARNGDASEAERLWSMAAVLDPKEPGDPKHREAGGQSVKAD
jgi:tetratricopeptide (TPR) repeat protein